MLNELAKEIHQTAVEKGWYDKPRSFGDFIALCHRELSEALEEYRNGRPMIYYNCTQNPAIITPCEYKAEDHCDLATLYYGECNFKGRKPEGVAVELADCIIWILDWCDNEGVDIDAIIRIKHEFNKTRPYRHGGKVI